MASQVTDYDRFCYILAHCFTTPNQVLKQTSAEMDLAILELLKEFQQAQETRSVRGDLK